MLKKVFTIALLLTVCEAAYAKSGRTFYTDERIAVAKENIAKYDWAKKVRKRIFQTGDPIRYYTGAKKYTAADAFAAQSDEYLWLLQPTTKIARVVPQARRATCPVCGDKVKKVSVWNPFRIDPIKHPYQVQCPMCKTWFPSNKYHLGDMTSGNLPDDGDGGIYKGEGPGKGKRFYFLREYAHMCYGTVVVPSLKSLSQAWLISGDKKYAHKGCILLARLATEYPNYGWDDPNLKLENRFDRTYLGPWNDRHPHYKWKSGGMITDLIWETWNLEDTAYAYDGLYDYMDDPKVIAFLKKKGMPIKNGEDLRKYIEDYIFRAGMNALLKGKIKGNEGFHQAAALAVALVMDDYSNTRPNSKDMVDYAYHGIGHSAYILSNGLTRDGGGHESPNYNCIKLDFIRVARLMEEVRKRRPDKFPLEKYPDIFAGPKAKGIFDYYIDIACNDGFYPPIGDCSGIGSPGKVNRLRAPRYSLLAYPHLYLYAIQRYGDPRHARACTAQDGSLYTGELWEPYPEAKIREGLARPDSRIERRSRLLDGYGVAILESGKWPKRRTACLNYTSLRGHRQCDNLSLYLFARGVHLLPDLGYPRTWDYIWQWDWNSMAHNTVTVDETRPRHSIGGGGRLFASADGVHVVTAHHDPYPDGMRLGTKEARPVDLYERAVIMIDVDEDRFYTVDLFAVNGGEQHDQSWHAMFIRPEAPDLGWKRQSKGTLAGADVTEFAPYTDRWGRSHKKGDFPSYLTEIRRAKLEKAATWVWKSGLPEGDTLHLHVLPLRGPAEVIMGRGRSPVWKSGKLDYLLVRRRVKDGAASRFLTILDAFQKTPVVQEVRVRSENPLVLEVLYADGMDEITLNIPTTPSRTTAHRPVGVRVRSRKGGQLTRDLRVGHFAPNKGPGYLQAKIQALDYEKRAITIPVKPGTEEAFAPGRAIRIYNMDCSGLYRIEQAQREGDAIRLTLDTTALFARGPVKAAVLSKVFLDAHLVFATGRIGGGGLKKGQYAFAGAWLGEGPSARQVKAATRTGVILLKEKVLTKTLQDQYKKGEVVSIWHYGIGDRVETARIETNK